MRWQSWDFPLPGPDLERTRAFRLLPAGVPRRRVIAFHGAGNDALFAWVGLFKELLSNDIEIFSFDLPGHGRNQQTVLSAEHIREAIPAVVAEACRPRKLPTSAIGVSLGGSLLLHSLCEIQHLVDSAAVLVAPSRIELSASSVLAELRPSTVAMLWRERQHYGATGLIPSFASFKRDIYPLRLARAPAATAFGYVDVLNEVVAELSTDNSLADIRLPVLLIYGRSDRIVPVEQGRRFAEAIPNSRILEIKRGSHLSTPLDPKAVAGLKAWLGRE